MSCVAFRVVVSVMHLSNTTCTCACVVKAAATAVVCMSVACNSQPADGDSASRPCPIGCSMLQWAERSAIVLYARATKVASASAPSISRRSTAVGSSIPSTASRVNMGRGPPSATNLTALHGPHAVAMCAATHMDEPSRRSRPLCTSARRQLCSWPPIFTSMR